MMKVNFEAIIPFLVSVRFAPGHKLLIPFSPANQKTQ
ncbi:MAG: hypothetical protein ACD_3C00220G0001, partial [uncultured bacterium (gcode 4)]